MRFEIGQNDISSSDIERIINPQTHVFNDIKKFTIVDNSKFRSTLGVFLGLFKNMQNVEELWLFTKDNNICVLFGCFLPFMQKLKKLHWIHEENAYTTKKIEECFEVINNTTKLTDIFVVNTSINLANATFRNTVVNEIQN